MDAAEAVEVQVFGEARGVGEVGGGLAGDGGDELEEDVAEGGGRMGRGGGKLCAGPGGDHAAKELARGGEGEAGLGPAQDVADLLEVGEGVIGLLEGEVEVRFVGV